MWGDVFIRLLLAHVVGDFVFQTDEFCRKKLGKGFRGPHLYLHSLVIFILSWAALGCLSCWWLALIVGVSHLVIDLVKRKEDIVSFMTDQIAHVICLMIVSNIFIDKGLYVDSCYDCGWINTLCVYALVFLCNGKPANILIKHLLMAYSVKGPNESDTADETIRSGKLIGNLERWLIIVFMLCGQYEAIGFLIAAKSIIRYKDGDISKTEYVLAGTLISVFIAVITGLLLVKLVD